MCLGRFQPLGRDVLRLCSAFFWQGNELTLRDQDRHRPPQTPPSAYRPPPYSRQPDDIRSRGSAWSNVAYAFDLRFSCDWPDCVDHAMNDRTYAEAVQSLQTLKLAPSIHTRRPLST